VVKTSSIYFLCIQGVATISGSLDVQGTLQLLGGDNLLAAANRARQSFDESGDLPTIVLLQEPDENASQWTREAYEYYNNGKDKPEWKTWRPELDAFSLANTACLDVLNMTKNISPTPVLFIAGTKALTFPYSEKAYNNAKEPKALYPIEGATHMDLYYKEPYVNMAADKLVDFFK